MERNKTDDDLFYDQGAFAIDALESWIGIEKVPAASCYNHQLDHHDIKQDDLLSDEVNHVDFLGSGSMMGISQMTLNQADLSAVQQY